MMLYYQYSAKKLAKNFSKSTPILEPKLPTELVILTPVICHEHTQDEIARIRKRKRGRNMLNRSGNTTDNLCFRYRFRDVFSRFRCCVYNGTGPLFVHVKHNGNMELHVSATF